VTTLEEDGFSPLEDGFSRFSPLDLKTTLEEDADSN
jgi:hypothetical protein